MKLLSKLLPLILIIAYFFNPSISAAKDIYSFKFPDSAGGEINMKKYKGKTILLFASSTDCGFRDQYADFQEIYQKYKNFVVIGISSDDLNVKETRKGGDIKSFCSGRFGATYPISDVIKVNTNSKDVHPFFVWAKQNGIRFNKNFEKVLIDKSGKVIKKFKRDQRPNRSYVTKQIEKIL